MGDPKDRVIQVGRGGWMQPSSDMPCGATRMKPFPEAVHLGCKGCKAEIKRLLLALVPPKEPQEAPEQRRFEWD